VNSNFSNNTAVDGGGAVIADASVSITGGVFSGNYTDSGLDEDAVSDFSNSGGAVLASGSVSITGATFSNNVAPGVGGAVSSGDDVDVTSSTFNGNRAGGSAGAIYASGTFSSVSSTFSSNQAGYSGGAVYASGDVTVSAGSLFQSNTAGSFDSEGDPEEDARGGAIVTGSDISISDSFFTLNAAEAEGGAVSANSATVQGSTFRENSSGKDGGAIYNNGALEILDSNFVSNSAAYAGGAVHSNLGSYEGSPVGATVRRSFFGSNTAYIAGALFLAGDGVVSRSTFVDNAATSTEDGPTAPFYTGEGSDGTVEYVPAGQSLVGGQVLLANNTFKSNFEDDKGTAVWTDGDIVFNTFIGGRDYDSIGYSGAYYNDQLVLGNIFPGGTEQFLANDGTPVLVDKDGNVVASGGVPAWRYFAGAHRNDDDLVFQDVRRDVDGNPIDEYDRIIDPVDYEAMKEAAYRESQVFDSEDKSTWNFFTSSMTLVSSGEFQLHYVPTSPLAKDFIVGNFTAIDNINSNNEDVRSIVLNDDEDVRDGDAVWSELTAARPANSSLIPEGVVGPRVGSDKLGTIRTFAWDAGAIEMGTRIAAPQPVTPPPAPSFGGGFAAPAPTLAPAPTVVAFEPVRASVRGFAANSSRLTAAMRKDLRKLVRQNPGATSVTCKGFTSAPPTPGDARLSRQRGKAVCDFVKRLNPDLTVRVLKGAYEDVPGSQIRRVRVVLR
jgi:predicted outer membrane repeat protein